jgi:hypothetical protein
MAEQKMQIEMVEVKAEDIIAERRAMYDSFMGASVYAIGATIVLLIGLYLFFG